MLRIILIIIVLLVAIPFYNIAKDFVKDNSDKVKLGVEVIKKAVD